MKKFIKKASVIILVVIILMQTPIAGPVTAHGAAVVSKVKLSRSSVTLEEGESVQLKASIAPKGASNKKIIWSSNNKKIAAVSSGGKVKAMKPGRAIITARSTNGKTASCKITVNKKVVMATSIQLSQTSITMNADDENITITASVIPSNTTNKEITWSSDDESVAFVDSDGTVMPLQQGSTQIHAKTENGIITTCQVTINEELITESPIEWEDSLTDNITGDVIDDVSNDVADDVTNDVTEDSTNNTNQEEAFTRAVLADGTYLLTLSGTGLCLDVDGSATVNGTNVLIFSKHGGSNQIWSFENHSDKTVSFISQCAKDKVLDVMRTGNSTKGGLKENCNVDIYDHNDEPAQSFYLEQASDGTYLIRLNSNPDLVVAASAANSGANVIVKGYDSSSRLQRWDIKSVAPPVPDKTDDFQTKLSSLKTKFPAGAYWNHVGSSKNNPDGYTYEGCNSHKFCNEYSNAWQCHGFALKLGADMFGTNPRNWKRASNLNNLRAGDIIRYNTGKYEHTVFVTGVNGNSVTIADCNYDLHCRIRWDVVKTKSEFEKVVYVMTR